MVQVTLVESSTADASHVSVDIRCEDQPQTLQAQGGSPHKASEPAQTGLPTSEDIGPAAAAVPSLPPPQAHAAPTAAPSTAGHAPLAQDEEHSSTPDLEAASSGPDTATAAAPDQQPSRGFHLPRSAGKESAEEAASGLEPATPPLSSPEGASPTSRPVSDGDSAAAHQGLTQYEREVAESIRAAIESRISVDKVRKHPPDAMDEQPRPAPGVASAEIETPAQSPKEGGGAPGPEASTGDSLGRVLRAQAARLKHAVMAQRVNFMDIARSPRLAKAARAELDGCAPARATLAHDGGAHSAQGEGQQGALEAVDAEADAEVGPNRELAAAMCARMDAARRAAEKLLGVLQACAGAEAAYARALTAASRVPLVGECDGASLRGGLSGFSDLPFMVAQAHVRVGAGLADATRGMQELVSGLRQACADVSLESARVQRAVDGARRHLHTALAEHQAVCRLADDTSALERARGRAARPFGEAADPWLAEARLVAAHAQAQAAQAGERAFLSASFARVTELEAQRVDAVRAVVAAFAAAYRGGLEAVKADTAPLLRAAEDMDGGADLAELRGSCEAAAGAGAALGSRQAGALGAAAQELLCSPEITRQGEMARWVSGSGRWTDCHFVLTRRGFLHWFSSSPPTPAEIVPADSLSLSRCQFETGEAPEFNLVETATGMFGRSRRLIFKASSVEDCCEWAIVLRESIAACRDSR